MIRFLVLLCGVFWLAVPSSASETATEFKGFARVIDGDTIFIGNVKISLFGIDALEPGQFCRRDREHWPCGNEATEHLWSLIGDGDVSCDILGKGRDGILIGRCVVEGLDLGAAMVDAGLAMAYRRFSKDYIENEMVARERRIGMFGGSYTVPWVWRRR